MTIGIRSRKRVGHRVGARHIIQAPPRTHGTQNRNSGVPKAWLSITGNSRGFVV